MSGNSDKIDELRRRKAKSQSGGGQKRIAAQHAKGEDDSEGEDSGITRCGLIH